MTLRAAYEALPVAARARVDARLAGLGIVEALRVAAPACSVRLIDTALASPAPPLSRLRRLQLYLGGTAWAPVTAQKV